MRTNLQCAGYVWDVFAYFPFNAGGVRVAVRKTRHGAERFARLFKRRNRVETSWRLRFARGEKL